MPRRNIYLLFLVTVVCLACAAKVSHYGRVLIFAMDEIEHRALRPVDRDELFQGALMGMASPLDNYSVYMPPVEADLFNEVLDQKFGGVGIEVMLDPETQQLTVASPLVGTPAYEAGVQAGDKILRVDDKSTMGLSLEDAVERMRGDPGDPVTLTILHVGQTEPEEIRIVRAKIQIDTVLGDMRHADGSWNYFLDGHDRIGYLRVNSFGEQTAEELQAAVTWLADHDARALILDVRNNPGGLLGAAVEICDLFIDSGTIVSIRRRDPEQIEKEYTATTGGTRFDLPMAVLVNRYSASASEIVTACLQDHERAVVVGERSYGKGTVQEMIQLLPGQGTLKLTTASYWRPSNKNIHRHDDTTPEDDWGVSPDEGYERKLEEDELTELVVWRRDRDIHKLDNGDNPPENDEADSYFDPQLLKAVEAVEEQLEPRS